MRDITDRKLAEESLRQSETYYRSLFEGAFFGFVVTGPDFRFQQVNDTFCRFLEYSAEELIGMKLVDVTYPEDIPKSTDLYNQEIRGEIDHFLTEKRYVTKSGQIKYGLVSAQGFFDEGGQFVWGTATILDITERKRAEEMIRQLNEELEERVAERTKQLQSVIEELEAFTYSLSHDLRAPLRVMDRFSEALEEDYGNVMDDIAKDYLRRIRTGSQRLGNMINQLLWLSRISRKELAHGSIDLSQMAREIAEELQDRDPNRILEFRIQDGLTAEGDQELLRLVLQNLLENAWKFSKSLDPAIIEYGITTRGEIPTFFVKDNGIGFDNADAERIFQVFVRLHNDIEYQGTGLGLPIVKRIVTRYGGTVWAAGILGQGATFYFTLPQK
ncbi:MAG TPA: PAS domain S-box protein [Candidatus Lokiarchaeia archaeon]|nr:PAS domain S-box protein [Candidatus Lokiarchaeia archaeon]